MIDDLLNDEISCRHNYVTDCIIQNVNVQAAYGHNQRTKIYRPYLGKES